MKSIIPIIGLTLSTLTKGNMQNYLGLTNEGNFYKETESLILVGNSYENIKLFDFSHFSKDVLVYNSKASDDAVAIFFDFESNSKNYFYSTSISDDTLIREINAFYFDFNVDNVLKSSSNSIIKDVKHGSLRQVFKPYGYMDYDYYLKKYEFSQNSSLYFFNVTQMHTPGSRAILLGDDSYEDYKLHKTNFTALKASQYDADIGWDKLYGSMPIYYSHYPGNSKVSTTVSSTYGGDIDFTFSSSGEVEIGAGFSYRYGTAYTKDDPDLSVQKDSNDENKIVWSFDYKSDSNKTNYAELSYVFELANRYQGNTVTDLVNLEIYGQMNVYKSWFRDDIQTKKWIIA